MFEINSMASEYLENAQWTKAKLSTSLDGHSVFGGFVPHTIEATVLPIADWEMYKLLEGSQVLVQTTNYFDRGQFAIYSGIFKSITATQRSLNMENVTLSFLLFLGINPS